MKRGHTEAETLRLNGWGVGDVLEGYEYESYVPDRIEGYVPDRVLITAVGEEAILCRWDYGCKGKFGEEYKTTLNFREWRKVE